MVLAKGMKATVVNGHTFTVDERYSPKKLLGRGSFGVVCTAHDSVTDTIIAIKRIRPYANDEWDARHTLREVRLMRLLGAHPNIISLHNLAVFDDKSELYMMMELMDCDLHRIIQSKQGLSDQHFKCFGKQMLEGVKAMHALGVFHRDLKPGNILVSKDCQLRITDFGLARFMDDATLEGTAETNPMTEYVVTRWYRCPELLLSPNRPYTEVIDVWSIGCILGELVKRKPLFPGKSHPNQVQLILEVMGYRKGDNLGFPLSDEAKSFLERKCQFRAKGLPRFVPDASSEVLGVLTSLLNMDPSRRPTAAQALANPYFSDAQLTVPKGLYESLELSPPTKDFFGFDKGKHSIEKLQGMIRDEVSAAQGQGSSSEPLSAPTRTPTPMPTMTAEAPHAGTGAGAASAPPSAVNSKAAAVAQEGGSVPDGSRHPAGPFTAATQIVQSQSQAQTQAHMLSRQSSGAMDAGQAGALRRQASLESASSMLSAASTLKSGASVSSGMSGLSASSRGEGGVANGGGGNTPSPRKMQQIMSKDRKIKDRLAMKDEETVGGSGTGLSTLAQNYIASADKRSAEKQRRMDTPAPTTEAAVTAKAALDEEARQEKDKGMGGILGTFKQALNFTRRGTTAPKQTGTPSNPFASGGRVGSAQPPVIPGAARVRARDNQGASELDARRVYAGGSSGSTRGTRAAVPMPRRSSSARPSIAPMAASASSALAADSAQYSALRAAAVHSDRGTDARTGRRKTFGDPVGSFSLLPTMSTGASTGPGGGGHSQGVVRGMRAPSFPVDYGKGNHALEVAATAFHSSSAAGLLGQSDGQQVSGAGGTISQGSSTSKLPALDKPRRRTRDRRTL